MVGCMNAILGVHALPSGRTMLSAASGIDPVLLARVAGYGADVVDQWGGPEAMARHTFEEPAVLSWERSRAQIEANRYYAEWAKPQGIADVIGLILARDATAVGSLGFARHFDAGPVTETEVGTLRLILPHLQRAVAISRVLDLKAIVAEGLSAALDAQPAGIILVDADLGIVHANTAAQAMLEKGDPIASLRGRLHVPFALGHDALANAVTLASSNEAAIGRRGFGIPARTTSNAPTLIHVLPLRRGRLRPGLNASAAAAVFVAASTSVQLVPEQAIAALFDLTPAEIRVFNLVVEGRSNRATAEALGVSLSTIKSHMLRVLEKTGAGNRAGLVKLAHAIKVPA
jgi:DNA-binding CsgD family transcriptional regulator